VSIVFPWAADEFGALLATCEVDDVTPHLLEHLPRRGVIVEAGCGLGRYVKYLADRGYDIVGVELGGEALRCAKQEAPEIRLIQGDVLRMPFPTNSIAGIVSLGVIEHFSDGCDAPLREIYRVLRPSGQAVITVPSMNWIRRIKRLFFVQECRHWLGPRQLALRSNWLRRLFGKPPLTETFRYNRWDRRPYAVFPTYGEFLEYRLTRSQYEQALRRAGFEILLFAPIAQVDGLLHEFGARFVVFDHWVLRVTRLGKAALWLLSHLSACHNHMQLCVVRKP
jgi:SAM-dependent methyltransferase